MDMEISLGQAGEPLEVQFIFYVDAGQMKNLLFRPTDSVDKWSMKLLSSAA